MKHYGEPICHMINYYKVKSIQAYLPKNKPIFEGGFDSVCSN